MNSTPEQPKSGENNLQNTEYTYEKSDPRLFAEWRGKYLAFTLLFAVGAGVVNYIYPDSVAAHIIVNTGRYILTGLNGALILGNNIRIKKLYSTSASNERLLMIKDTQNSIRTALISEAALVTDFVIELTKVY